MISVKKYIGVYQDRAYYLTLIALVMGVIFGLLILYPANEFVSYFELHQRDVSLFQYVGQQITARSATKTGMDSIKR